MDTTKVQSNNPAMDKKNQATDQRHQSAAKPNEREQPQAGRTGQRAQDEEHRPDQKSAPGIRDTEARNTTQKPRP